MNNERIIVLLVTRTYLAKNFLTQEFKCVLLKTHTTFSVTAISNGAVCEYIYQGAQTKFMCLQAPGIWDFLVCTKVEWILRSKSVGLYFSIRLKAKTLINWLKLLF